MHCRTSLTCYPGTCRGLRKDLFGRYKKSGRDERSRSRSADRGRGKDDKGRGRCAGAPP